MRSGVASNDPFTHGCWTGLVIAPYPSFRGLSSYGANDCDWLEALQESTSFQWIQESSFVHLWGFHLAMWMHTNGIRHLMFWHRSMLRRRPCWVGGSVPQHPQNRTHLVVMHCNVIQRRTTTSLTHPILLHHAPSCFGAVIHGLVLPVPLPKLSVELTKGSGTVSWTDVGRNVHFEALHVLLHVVVVYNRSCCIELRRKK